MKTLSFLLGSLACFTIAFFTATGDILSFISFADVLNEMGFFVAASMMGMLLMLAFFESSREAIRESRKSNSLGLNPKNRF